MIFIDQHAFLLRIDYKAVQDKQQRMEDKKEKEKTVRTSKLASQAAESNPDFCKTFLSFNNWN